MDLGWYSILFFIVSLPGLLFRRSYYWGAFTKQYTPKNVVISIFYSIIIGVPITYLSLYFYNNFFTNWFGWTGLDSVNFVFISDTIDSKNGGHYIVSLLENKRVVLKFISFTFIIFFISFSLGSISYKLVRFFRLDKKLSFLKFSNHWHYYFRGEFLQFRDFKSNEKSIEFVYADILLDTGEGNNTLYSGIVTQYELDKTNNTKLESIHLTEPSRYKGKESKPIESDCLIIPYDKTLNINLRVAYFELTDNESKEYFKKYLKIVIPILILLATIAPFFTDFFSSWSHPFMARFLLGNILGGIPHTFKEVYLKEGKKKRVKEFWNSLGKIALIVMMAILVYSLWFFILSFFR